MQFLCHGRHFIPSCIFSSFGLTDLVSDQETRYSPRCFRSPSTCRRCWKWSCRVAALAAVAGALSHRAWACRRGSRRWRWGSEEWPHPAGPRWPRTRPTCTTQPRALRSHLEPLLTHKNKVIGSETHMRKLTMYIIRKMGCGRRTK